MKIAIVTSGGVGRDGVHGAVPCLMWLIERLVQAGDEVHVFIFQQEPDACTWPLRGATVHNAGSRSPRRGMLRQIIAEHRRGRFDIIHSLWSPWAEAIAALTGRLLRVPVLLYFANYELVGFPDVKYGDQLSTVARMLLRWALAHAGRVAGQSEPVVRLLAQRGYPALRLPLGVALNEWPLRAPRRRDPAVPAKLLHVAHVTPAKDHAMLLEAAARLKAAGVAFELDLIGIDIPGDGSLMRRVSELGLDGQVRHHGFLRREAIRDFFERADLLVVTSRFEAGPLVVLEAAIAGVPTVGTAVGHLAEWAPRAARVVQPTDAVALAAELEEILGDEEQRLDLAVRAQRAAVEEDADITSRRFRDVYQEMVGQSAT
ncbi:glycosyltransferase family 4 protein [Nitrospirillum sp. BR 11752]|uniref:glycosyltransferase family 4 protein n=1 Tax=Nitrospirillum sp. BR 11752 TaxID=3104293 RepID=UPI002EA06E13|nr:glycosyltransferase family 4 protein [Nitrospirillum sp. BR 11752]